MECWTMPMKFCYYTGSSGTTTAAVAATCCHGPLYTAIHAKSFYPFLLFTTTPILCPVAIGTNYFTQ